MQTLHFFVRRAHLVATKNFSARFRACRNQYSCKILRLINTSSHLFLSRPAHGILLEAWRSRGEILRMAASFRAVEEGGRPPRDAGTDLVVEARNQDLDEMSADFAVTWREIFTYLLRGYKQGLSWKNDTEAKRNRVAFHESAEQCSEIAMKYRLAHDGGRSAHAGQKTAAAKQFRVELRSLLTQSKWVQTEIFPSRRKMGYI